MMTVAEAIRKIDIAKSKLDREGEYDKTDEDMIEILEDYIHILRNMRVQ